MLRDFPRAIRRDARPFWLAMLLFFGPLILMALAAAWEPRWMFPVLGPEDTCIMDGMYGKDDPVEFMRDEFGSDFGMFGSYVMNKITVGLHTAGAGLLAMVGAMFQLGYQGIVIGAMEGYVHNAGNPERFYVFFGRRFGIGTEGIVTCGMAGIRLGQSVLKPGRLTRSAALAAAGKRSLALIYGGALLIFFAAFIEGFRPTGPASTQTKYAAGLFNALSLALFLSLCGGNDDHDA